MLDMGIDPLLHSSWKCSGVTLSTLAVSICAVFRLPAVGTVAWELQMHVAKASFTVFLGPRSLGSLLSTEIFLGDFPL